MRFTRTLMLAAALCLCRAAPAAADPDSQLFQDPHTWFGVDLGLALGGSDVLDSSVSHGLAQKSYVLTAGDSEYLGLHLNQDLGRSGFTVRAAAAYGVVGEQSSCLGPYSDSCLYTLQHAIYLGELQYRIDDSWNVGVARVFHRNIVLESHDDGNPFPDVGFKPAAGWALELEHHVGGAFWGVRITHMIYHTIDTGASANANSVGVYAGIEGPIF